jgi:hypothetical protein
VFITNHALAGTAIGLAVRRPAVAFVAGLASHLAMDCCPHWGDENLVWEEFVAVARVDGTVGLAVCAASLAAAPRSARPAVAAAIAGACVIDMDKVGRHFIGRSPFPAWFDRFHGRIQNQHQDLWVVEAGVALALTAWLADALAPAARYRARGGQSRRSRHGDRRPRHAFRRR